MVDGLSKQPLTRTDLLCCSLRVPKIWTGISDVPFQAHKSVHLLMWNSFLMGHGKNLNWGWTSDLWNWHIDSCIALGHSTAAYSICFTECHLVLNCCRTEVKWRISHIKIDVFINMQPIRQNEMLALNVSAKHSYVSFVYFICSTSRILLCVISRLDYMCMSSHSHQEMDRSGGGGRGPLC